MLCDTERLYSFIETCPSPFASRNLNHVGRPVGSLSDAFEKRYERRLSTSLPVPPAEPVSTRLASGSSVFERLSLLRREALLLDAIEAPLLAGVLIAAAPADLCITSSSIVIMPS
jgi:hypothetical protein